MVSKGPKLAEEICLTILEPALFSLCKPYEKEPGEQQQQLPFQPRSTTALYLCYSWRLRANEQEKQQANGKINVNECLHHRVEMGLLGLEARSDANYKKKIIKKSKRRGAFIYLLEIATGNVQGQNP